MNCWLLGKQYFNLLQLKMMTLKCLETFYLSAVLHYFFLLKLFRDEIHNVPKGYSLQYFRLIKKSRSRLHSVWTVQHRKMKK